MKTLSYIFILLFTAFSYPTTAVGQDTMTTEKEQLIELKKQLISAVDSAERQEVARAGYALEQFFNHPELKKYARYYAGYAWYRMYNMPTEDGSEPEEKFLDSCISHLEKAVENDPKFAEAHALLGSAYGMKATGVFSGMKYGPKSDSSLEKAMELAPENPRVYMIDGIGKIYKPSMFGGGIDKALESLNKAASLFKTFEPADELSPDWGHAEVYAWIGQAYTQKEDLEKAEQAYRQALEINPDYGWVKYDLLPALTQN